MDGYDEEIQRDMQNIKDATLRRRLAWVIATSSLMAILEYAMIMIVYPVQGDFYLFLVGIGSTIFGIVLLSGIPEKIDKIRWEENQ